jgi:hypothetical protein
VLDRYAGRVVACVADFEASRYGAVDGIIHGHMRPPPFASIRQLAVARVAARAQP